MSERTIVWPLTTWVGFLARRLFAGIRGSVAFHTNRHLIGIKLGIRTAAHAFRHNVPSLHSNAVEICAKVLAVAQHQQGKTSTKNLPAVRKQALVEEHVWFQIWQRWNHRYKFPTIIVMIIHFSVNDIFVVTRQGGALIFPFLHEEILPSSLEIGRAHV